MQSDFFRCLQCGNSTVKKHEDSWICTKCNTAYPLLNGIPILVKNWEIHQNELEQAKKVKPGWYLEEQPAEQVSPWRHHIKKRRMYIQHEIESHLAAQGNQKFNKVLDLGCGDGNHLEYLKNYANVLYGSDYNLVRLARSQAKYNHASLFLADILDYPAQDNFFDMVFFHHVIEHITEDQKALETIFRILKPGGLLILGTPNEGAWWWQLAYKLQPETLKSTDHVQFYTAKTLSTRMHNAKFNIQKIKHIGWGPPHWGLDARIRGYKWVDDTFESFGKIFFPQQSSSLYIIASKPG